MIDQERDFIRQLTAKTLAGRLRWVEGGLPDSYHLTLGGSTLFVSTYQWDEDLPDIVMVHRVTSFRVLSEGGHRVLEVEAEADTTDGSLLAGLLEAASKSTERYHRTLDGLNKILATV